MEAVKEQIICVQVCFKVGNTAVESDYMLREAYGDDALRHMTSEGFRSFKNRRTTKDDDEWSGKP
jgi:hypothetical protein